MIEDRLNVNILSGRMNLVSSISCDAFGSQSSKRIILYTVTSIALWDFGVFPVNVPNNSHISIILVFNISSLSSLSRHPFWDSHFSCFPPGRIQSSHTLCKRIPFSGSIYNPLMTNFDFSPGNIHFCSRVLISLAFNY